MEHVIHVSADIHEQVSAYCKKHNIRMKAWTEKILSEAISIAQRPVQKPVKKPTPVFVSSPKECAPPIGELNDPSNVWERPPFWVGASNHPKTGKLEGLSPQPPTTSDKTRKRSG